MLALKNIITNINWIEKHNQKSIHHDQADYIQEMKGWISICKSINVIQHLNKTKRQIKITRIITLETERPLIKFNICKSLGECKHSKGVSTNITKATIVAHIILKRKKRKAFLLKSETLIFYWDKPQEVAINCVKPLIRTKTNKWAWIIS